MTDVVVHMTKCKPGSTIASTRIANFLAEELEIPLVDDTPELADEYGTVFLVNGPSAFFEWRDELAEMIRRCQLMVWVQNDYTVFPPTQVRRALEDADINVVFWSTIPARIEHSFWRDYAMDEDRCINWNRLTWTPIQPEEPTIPGLFYYGAFRDGRRRFFEEYLDTTLYPVHVSASKKAFGKFEDMNALIEQVDPLPDLVKQIQQFTATVYCEDRWSHENYCCPANRFYECLSAGLCQFIDVNSVHTLEEGGFEVPEEWMVSCAEDVAERLEEAWPIALLQRQVWGQGDHVQDLRDEVQEARAML